MDIENCNFSGLDDDRNKYCLDAKNKIEILKQLLESSNFDRSSIQNTVELLKQAKSNLTHCDDSIQVLLEGDALLQDIKESASLSADIDNTIKEAESLLDKFDDTALEMKFNGETDEWFRFWESFESEIHDRADLSPQFKLTCLKNRLESWALHMISNLGTGESAYDEAINLLQTTFSNKKALVESHLNALLDLKPPVATPVSLMRFKFDFEYHMRALKAYETDIEEPGILIAAVLNKKLPKEIWHRLNKADKRSFWTFPEFQSALNFEIELLNFELAQNSNSSSDGSQNCANFAINDDTAKNVFVNGVTSSQATVCQICSGSHEIDHCTVYRMPTEKTKRARELDLCFVCFEAGHVSENCEKPGCEFCNKKHNTLMCFSQKQKDNKKISELKVKHSKRAKSKVKKTFICPLCSGHHQITGCTVYKSEQEKMVRVKNLKLCLMCINSEHITENCLKTSGCKFCGEWHNSVLCVKTKSESGKKKKGKKKKKRGKKKKKIVCQLCLGHHQITGCTVYKSEAEKMKRAKELNLCLLCINSDHFTEYCLKTSGCKFCGEWHNSLLCIKSKSANKECKKKKTCPLCSQPHQNTGTCTVYKSAAEKMERVKILNLCLVCFKNDHSTEKCKETTCCKFCRGKHNTMLCVSGNKEIKTSKVEESNNSQLFLDPNFTGSQSTNCQKQLNIIQNGIRKATVQDNESEISKRLVTCILCSGNHEFGLCYIYKTYVEKRVRAVYLQLCLMCVDNSHTTDQCLKMNVCKFCGGRHHTLLCIESEEATKVVDKKLKSRKKKKKKKKVLKTRKEIRSTEITNPLISNFLLFSDI